ncbi:hypothetical protein R3P38DRAFT_2818606 [Favolaschia claudopus]|uniref:Uncharacterized protein n=1 Tax=Favolaschia claudopus TaxID=2862362 RepID=A0AAW0EFE6_9AGAR
MSLSSPPAGRRPLFPTAKIKLKFTLNPKPRTIIPDTTFTLLQALSESADACPPLKSAVGGVKALWTVAQRTKHCKSDALDIARRSNEILNNMADAVPDASTISPPMLESIERFTLLLDDVRTSMEEMAQTGRLSRLLHLNRNEQAIKQIQAQLDNAYRDFVAASTLRVEVQQTQLVLEQSQIALTQDKIAQCQDLTLVAVKEGNAASLDPKLSTILFYSKLNFFG